jgi:hypothetical protein
MAVNPIPSPSQISCSTIEQTERAVTHKDAHRGPHEAIAVPKPRTPSDQAVIVTRSMS